MTAHDEQGVELRVHLTRVSGARHRMEIVRADGTRESCDLETKSCLLHDLVHFALESEAGLRDGLFGRLARGVAYAALAQPMQDLSGGDELVAVESVVGPLQGAWKRGYDAQAFLATLRAYRASLGEPCPAWLDADLLARVGARLRQLEGQWRATRFGQTMELRFAAG